jgi:glycosyltransferase involved in cell wall biosynthesis
MKSIRTGLTIFIPVYNEESLLIPNTKRLIRFLDSLKVPYEIIIGSNGSTDGTVALADELCHQYGNIRFFHLLRKGVGAAFREGVKMAEYDRIITVDIDLSINLEFVRVAERLLTQFDIVIGSKITGSQRRTWIRKLASNLFISVARFLFRIGYHDYSIAAKGYRKEVVEKYMPYIDDKTFYVVQIVYRAYHDRRRLKEIPVQCHDIRESRFNLIHEGVYKFANLFILWLSSIKEGRSQGAHKKH